MRPRVLVGLPSFNEAATIATVTRDIDSALADLPFRAEAVLVNADNSSPDGTADVFLSTPTRHAKRAITTPRASGKGENWRATFELLRDEAFDVGLVVDTDLGSVPASWVHALVCAVADGGCDFAFPLRPATWNGGDLTYQLAYPVLAGTFGGDLREPLCGDIALSRHGAESVLEQEWMPSDRRFGVDALVASEALRAGSWRMVGLRERRRNKLRSFAPQGADYRMGAKFAEVATTIRRQCRKRLATGPMPERLIACAEPVQVAAARPVPLEDPDILRLAKATARRLAEDAGAGLIDALPEGTARAISDHIASNACARGLPWPLWREVLVSWLSAESDEAIATELLETLFLNRVVGHHTEIRGTVNWYDTVRLQADDFFAHRASLWSR